MDGMGFDRSAAGLIRNLDHQIQAQWPQRFPNIFHGKKCHQCGRESVPQNKSGVNTTSTSLIQLIKDLIQTQQWVYMNLTNYAKGFYCRHCGRGMHFFYDAKNQNYSGNDVRSMMQNPHQQGLARAPTGVHQQALPRQGGHQQPRQGSQVARQGSQRQGGNLPTSGGYLPTPGGHRYPMQQSKKNMQRFQPREYEEDSYGRNDSQPSIYRSRSRHSSQSRHRSRSKHRDHSRSPRKSSERSQKRSQSPPKSPRSPCYSPSDPSPRQNSDKSPRQSSDKSPRQSPHKSSSPEKRSSPKKSTGRYRRSRSSSTLSSSDSEAQSR